MAPGRNGAIAYGDSYGADEYIATDLYGVCADGRRERMLGNQEEVGSALRGRPATRSPSSDRISQALTV